ncbi:MAG: polyprenyl synthetase family protein [Clostridiales bacterium]|nr:polyprenyl synthetase family protein [Clostridiales bacterium]
MRWVNDQITKKIAEIEAILDQYLPKEEGMQKTIFEASNYSVRAGGKRLRPMIMKEVYTLFGGEGNVIEPFMAAIEMIHSSSLVHDDLPCMDNDEFRRGKLTTWKKYGYDMAVLAGDALMIYAFETAAHAFTMNADPVAVGRAIQILAQKTGIYGMIGGQTVDVELTNHPMNQEQLDFIYRLKTGALLEASMMIGAVLAGASEEAVASVEQIASKVGMAFQIQDDILDLTSTTEMLGKPVLSDEKNNKTTYVTLNGLEQSKQDVDDISKQAIEQLKQLPGQNIFLEQLIQMLIARQR